MNPNLIPSYDMLGLPAPIWLIQILMALTLALHWSFLGMTVGGAALVLHNGLRREPALVKLNRAFIPWLPFTLSMAMTMGIAPLLFVQVLYGNLFYTSNILLGFWWLALVPLVIINFYLFYAVRHKAQGESPVGWFVPGVMILIFFTVAMILSSNATLTQTPAAWEKHWAGGGNALYLRDRVLAFRVAFALLGTLAGGGIFMTIFGKAGLAYDEEANAAAVKNGLDLAVPALAIQIGFGVAGIIFMDGAQRSAMFSGFGLLLFIVSAAGFVATLFLAFTARGSTTTFKAVLPAVTYFVGLFALAGVRDTVRRAALEGLFSPSDVPVNSQWGSFALFLVTFLAGIGVLAYLVKLGLTPKEGAAAPDEPAQPAEVTG